MVKLFESLLGGKKMKSEEVIENPPADSKRYNGRIIKLDTNPDTGGYGFISSREIPYTRIFFHWSGLAADTLHFTKLKTGMKVTFVGFDVPGKGWRAIKIKVEE